MSEWERKNRLSINCQCRLHHSSQLGSKWRKNERQSQERSVREILFQYFGLGARNSSLSPTTSVSCAFRDSLNIKKHTDEWEKQRARKKRKRLDHTNLDSNFYFWFKTLRKMKEKEGIAKIEIEFQDRKAQEFKTSKEHKQMTKK